MIDTVVITMKSQADILAAAALLPSTDPLRKIGTVGRIYLQDLGLREHGWRTASRMRTDQQAVFIQPWDGVSPIRDIQDLVNATVSLQDANVGRIRFTMTDMVAKSIESGLIKKLLDVGFIEVAHEFLVGAAGVVEAGEAVRVDDNKDIGTFRNVSMQRLNAATGASVAGAIAALIGSVAGEGLKIVVQEETVVGAAVENALTTAFPAGSIPLAVLANVQTLLVAGGTSVTWSIGITGDVDKYGTAGFPVAADSLAKNTKSSFLVAPLARLAAPETLKVIAAAAGGAAAGDTAFSAGAVRVVAISLQFEALANNP